jgi:GntR family transcriptional regulator
MKRGAVMTVCRTCRRVNVPTSCHTGWVQPDIFAPKYRRVANTLRERIRTGEYPAGGRMPSEADLVSEFGYDRGTIRQAIKVLVREGLVDVQHGRGTFVRPRRRLRRNLVEGLRREYDLAVAGKEPPEGLYRAISGETGDVEVPTEYSWVEAPEDVAEDLQVPAGTALLCRRYLHVVDGEPQQVTHSYLLGDMVEGTPVADPDCARSGWGTIAQLASVGAPVDRIELGLRVWLATPEDVDALKMDEGQPVFGYRRVMFAARRPVEVADVASPGEQVVQEIVVDFGRAH